ncbi:hypothetical protein KJZ71_03500 [Patescibacteria group bacterium]|uniref:Cyclic nucleotide-binding domain-containing protein n=1 Tax=candidate division WWE3 bacterium TaxID=2053526 RepID=A0A928Y6J9_UNCKA|nr:hypothetical protein [Anaerolineales bacterium]MBE7525204.1 hypothetical protein [candidate division WWE3 bacterium]MCL4732838.1 hypothetical protein [Patescibacteria group bacterium]MDL1953018.1 hypothetical protein [Candidatus Uhrbacteria bacterium UHB]RIL00194.1 MAG: hypothetical protein DCC77_04900 [Candidatus Uhrbacteria bacterium]
MGTTPRPKQETGSTGDGKVLTNLNRARRLKLLLEANPGLAAAQIEVDAGEYIVRQGDFDPEGLPHAYLVFDGEVEERQSHFYPGIGHKEITVFRVPEGGIAFSQALYPVYAKMPAVTSVVAITPALVFMLRNEHLLDLYERDPELFQLLKVEYQMRMQVLSTMHEMAKLHELNDRATALVEEARPFLREHGWNMNAMIEVMNRHTALIDEAMAHASDAKGKSAEAFMELEGERERMRYRWRGAEMYVDRLRNIAEFAMGVIERLGVNTEELGIGRRHLDMTPEEKTLLYGESLEELQAVKHGLPAQKKPFVENLREEDIDGALSKALAAVSTRLVHQSVPPAVPSVRVGTKPPPPSEQEEDLPHAEICEDRITQVFDILPPSVGTPNVPPDQAMPSGEEAAAHEDGVIPAFEPPTLARPFRPKLPHSGHAISVDAAPAVPTPPEPFTLEEAPTVPSSRLGFTCPSPTSPGAYRLSDDHGTTTSTMETVVLPPTEGKK